MSDVKILINRVKKAELSRREIVDNQNIDFTEKSELLRKSIKNFDESLTDEDKEIMESDEFYEQYSRYLNNTEPKTKYEEYLLSPEWKQIRLKVLKRANYSCEGCGEAEVLDIHHLTYDRIGNELMIDLVALCKICHNKIHDNYTRSKWNKYLSEDKEK